MSSDRRATSTAYFRAVACGSAGRGDCGHPNAADPHRRRSRSPPAGSARSARASGSSSSSPVASKAGGGALAELHLEEHPGRGRAACSRTESFDVAVLVDALRRIAVSQTVIDPTIVARLVERSRKQIPLDKLTRA